MTKTIKGYIYTVRGKSHFPADMLSRCHCWPSTPGDVEKIFLTPEDVNYDQFFHTEREVKLGSALPPETGRWESFGWKVVLIEVI